MNTVDKRTRRIPTAPTERKSSVSVIAVVYPKSCREPSTGYLTEKKGLQWYQISDRIVFQDLLYSMAQKKSIASHDQASHLKSMRKEIRESWGGN